MHKVLKAYLFLDRLAIFEETLGAHFARNKASQLREQYDSFRFVRSFLVVLSGPVDEDGVLVEDEKHLNDLVSQALVHVEHIMHQDFAAIRGDLGLDAVKIVLEGPWYRLILPL